MHASLTLADFDFDLPPELIAQHPLADRSASRLLDATVSKNSGNAKDNDHHHALALHDRGFTDLLSLFAAGDLLVCNDTQVIKARLHGFKPTGGRVELLIERIVAPDRALALVRTSHKPVVGSTFEFAESKVRASVVARHGMLVELQFDHDVATVLDRWGTLPLPPYIGHAPDAVDATRYQTVYAAQPGAVAAPTAGLHFTTALLQDIQSRGVTLARITLHVGAGTFQPVRCERIEDHRMHAERFDIPEATAQAVARTRAQGGRVWAVGTTSLRALEAAALARDDGALAIGAQETALYIRPGFQFRVVDRLITNFHLPRSTLLMLVAAFMGLHNMRATYAHAIAQRYRFFSYGDAMVATRQ